jgi:hypothetical protein
MIKTVLASFIIGFFLITCLRVINQSITMAVINTEHAEAINRLDNTTFNETVNEDFKIVIGEGSIIICKPKVINNKAGRVCIAS